MNKQQIVKMLEQDLKNGFIYLILDKDSTGKTFVKYRLTKNLLTSKI